MSTWPGHPIIVDIETAPHPCAAEFLGPLNLDGITAAKNLKDPAKIAEDIQRRKNTHLLFEVILRSGDSSVEDWLCVIAPDLSAYCEVP